ncbi:hypothetical protein ACI3KS_11095 [Microbacterium sp. ZW T5_45]|uniref:hypothetical protein n=1 Tax=Microbacterium sp. ZW T5_45 TaxID=3378080 RepID=UPI00385340E0
MTDAPTQPRHLIALGAGIVAMLGLFLLPPGSWGYLLTAALGLLAVLIGHRAVVRRGPTLVAAIIGLVLGYLVLLLGAGLLIVRFLRLFTGA